jgi:glycosyltransferase involved in cell wall biosynthesis
MRALLDGLQAGNRSGTGRYTEQLVRHLLETGGEDAVRVLWPAETPLPEGAERFTACFDRVPAPGPLRRAAASQFLLRDRLRTHGADLVHFPATVGAAFTRLPSVVTVHDLSFLVEPRWFKRSRALYLRLMTGRSVGRALRVIAVSQSTAALLHDKLGLPRERISVVYEGVESRFRPADEEDVKRVRRKLDLPRDYLLYMGTLEPRKNLPALLRAFETTAGQHDLDLALAGRKGWRIDGFLTAAQRSPVAQRIRFPGFVAEEDQAALLSGAHAFVWPSLHEGFGFPPLEAMACGAPVLASNAPAMPEILGDAALLVDASDDLAFAEALARIIEDESLRRDLRARSLRRAARFDWRRTAEETLEVYRTALTEAGAERR